MRAVLKVAAVLGGLLPLGHASTGHGQGGTVSVCIGNQGALVTRNTFEVNEGSGYNAVRHDSLWATQKSCQNIPATARSVRLKIEVLNAVGEYSSGCVREYAPPRAVSLYIRGTLISRSCYEG